MRLPLAHNLCSQLQNGAMSRLRTVNVPCSNLYANVLSILLSQGFISSVTRGTRLLQDPTEFLSAPVQHRRLWVEMKYRDDQPVLRSMHAVSKPSLRVQMTKQELERLHAGKGVKSVRGLVTGEVCVVRTANGQYYEGREAIRAQLPSAEVICRVSS